MPPWYKFGLSSVEKGGGHNKKWVAVEYDSLKWVVIIKWNWWENQKKNIQFAPAMMVGYVNVNVNRIDRYPTQTPQTGVLFKNISYHIDVKDDIIYGNSVK